MSRPVRVAVLLVLLAVSTYFAWLAHMWVWWLPLLAVPLVPLDAWLGWRRRQKT